MTLATPLLLAGLMAGFGRVDLEPPAGHSLAGYFGPPRQAGGCDGELRLSANAHNVKMQTSNIVLCGYNSSAK